MDILISSSKITGNNIIQVLTEIANHLENEDPQTLDDSQFMDGSIDITTSTAGAINFQIVEE